MLHQPARRARLLGTTVALSSAVALLATACASSGSTTAAAASGAPGSSSSAAALTTLTIVSSGTDSFTGSLPLTIAKAKGYFKAEGIDLKQYTVSGGGASALPPLATGKAQVGFLSLATSLEADEQGDHELVLGASVQSHALTLPVVTTAFLKNHAIDPKTYVSQPLTERVKALKGATWAVGATGGWSDRWSSLLIQTAGLDPETGLTKVPNPPNPTGLLSQGRLDGALLLSADADPLIAAGTLVPVLKDNSADELLTYSKTLYYDKSAEIIIDNAWFKKNPEVGKRFFAAYQKGADFLFSHTTQEVYDATKSLVPDVPQARAIAQIEATKADTPADSKTDDASLQSQIDFGIESGAFTKKFAVTEVADFSYLPSPNLERTDW